MPRRSEGNRRDRVHPSSIGASYIRLSDPISDARSSVCHST
jgi:hypothetical protein